MASKRSLLSLNLPKEIIGLLTRNGYETVQDIRDSSPEKIASELGIPLSKVEAIVVTFQSQAQTASVPLSQPASQLLHTPLKVKTNSRPLDALLDGGLARGNILEISGPPGSPKETILMDMVVSFAKANEDVLFIDCSNMTSASTLAEVLRKASADEKDIARRVHYLNIYSVAELLLFFRQLSNILSTTHSEVSLLVFGSLSFPFQGHNLAFGQKSAFLEQAKQTFSKLCATRRISIVTTSQLSTKMVNADGSRGTFDSGGKGIMLPQLGSAYLVDGKSWRITACPNDPTTGFLKLLSSPKHRTGYKPERLERYVLVNGNIL
ncbi:P-loop containing nucleoside triphosphate hydrolase protein [Crepidotus variabilis]|uniref:DNA repair protein RAD51 homolog 3 n=1 Tax=Crepidotus variabilis TaxID=179855 RepID=A0A9P6EG22_9AGAR|nr:P-loop containing nucleoside triphosphate hydrolase protein [Crepidotus variabilis]